MSANELMCFMVGLGMCWMLLIWQASTMLPGELAFLVAVYLVSLSVRTAIPPHHSCTSSGSNMPV